MMMSTRTSPHHDESRGLSWDGPGLRDAVDDNQCVSEESRHHDDAATATAFVTGTGIQVGSLPQTRTRTPSRCHRDHNNREGSSTSGDSHIGPFLRTTADNAEASSELEASTSYSLSLDISGSNAAATVAASHSQAASAVYLPTASGSGSHIEEYERARIRLQRSTLHMLRCQRELEDSIEVELSRRKPSRHLPAPIGRQSSSSGSGSGSGPRKSASWGAFTGNFALMQSSTVAGSVTVRDRLSDSEQSSSHPLAALLPLLQGSPLQAAAGDSPSVIRWRLSPSLAGSGSGNANVKPGTAAAHTGSCRGSSHSCGSIPITGYGKQGAQRGSGAAENASLGSRSPGNSLTTPGAPEGNARLFHPSRSPSPLPSTTTELDGRSARKLTANSVPRHRGRGAPAIAAAEAPAPAPAPASTSSYPLHPCAPTVTRVPASSQLNSTPGLSSSLSLSSTSGGGSSSSNIVSASTSHGGSKSRSNRSTWRFFNCKFTGLQMQQPKPVGNTRHATRSGESTLEAGGGDKKEVETQSVETLHGAEEQCRDSGPTKESCSGTSAQRSSTISGNRNSSDSTCSSNSSYNNSSNRSKGSTSSLCRQCEFVLTGRTIASPPQHGKESGPSSQVSSTSGDDYSTGAYGRLVMGQYGVAAMAAARSGCPCCLQRFSQRNWRVESSWDGRAESLLPQGVVLGK